MLKPNDTSPEKNQTLLNGKLVTGETKLKHLDRIRFGLHNYFLFLDPNEVEFNQYDWEYANQEAIDNNVKDIEKLGHVETQELKDKL